MTTENTELNLDRSWTFDVNLGGLTVTGPIPKDLPKGFYKAKIEDMYVNLDKNPNRVVIKLVVTEGEFKGVIRTDGLSIPKSEEDKVRYYWRALAESAGYTPAQLDNGGIKLGADSFKGREVHIQYTPKNEATGVQYDKVDYMTASDWTARSTNNAAAGRNGSAATASNVIKSSDTTTKGDVFAKLGIAN